MRRNGFGPMTEVNTRELTIEVRVPADTHRESGARVARIEHLRAGGAVA